MKKTLVILFFITSVISQASAACQEKKISNYELQYLNNRVYFKDPVINHCFVYIWVGAGNGGPAIATISCDAVPREKLIILSD